MNLSVITPVLNEEFFLPLYLESVSKYADEILLLDGGSTDSSLEIIRNFQKRIKRKKQPVIRFWQIPQSGIPYSEDWQEGMRRNFLLTQARGKWVLLLDVDEFISDNFKNVFYEKILDSTIDLYGFFFSCFLEKYRDYKIKCSS